MNQQPLAGNKGLTRIITYHSLSPWIMSKSAPLLLDENSSNRIRLCRENLDSTAFPFRFTTPWDATDLIGESPLIQTNSAEFCFTSPPTTASLVTHEKSANTKRYVCLNLIIKGILEELSSSGFIEFVMLMFGNRLGTGRGKFTALTRGLQAL